MRHVNQTCCEHVVLLLELFLRVRVCDACDQATVSQCRTFRRKETAPTTSLHVTTASAQAIMIHPLSPLANTHVCANRSTMLCHFLCSTQTLTHICVCMSLREELGTLNNVLVVLLVIEVR